MPIYPLLPQEIQETRQFVAAMLVPGTDHTTETRHPNTRGLPERACKSASRDHLPVEHVRDNAPLSAVPYIQTLREPIARQSLEAIRVNAQSSLREKDSGTWR